MASIIGVGYVCQVRNDLSLPCQNTNDCFNLFVKVTDRSLVDALEGIIFYLGFLLDVSTLSM